MTGQSTGETPSREWLEWRTSATARGTVLIEFAVGDQLITMEGRVGDMKAVAEGILASCHVVETSDPAILRPAEGSA